VFLRGLMRDGRHWGAFPEQFRAALPEAAIELIDFPGNGLLNEQQSAARVEDMVESCRVELRRRGVALPVRVLAMSLGAMVAACWASRYPEEIEACVLVNTSLRPFSPPHWRLQPRAWPMLLRMILLKPEAREVETRIFELTTRLVEDRESPVDRWTKWRHDNPVSTRSALRQLAAAARYRAPATPPPVPLLILASAGDGLVDHRCSLRLAERWGREVAVHPRAGHDLPLDDGPWVAEQIRRWLASGIDSGRR
jgi:pimeloyl-ACP methyl ester carboxylesterase